MTVHTEIEDTVLCSRLSTLIDTDVIWHLFCSFIEC